MKERGMIFNGEMVRAILDGRKTQTRRPVNGTATALLWLRGEYPQKKYNIGCPFGNVGDRIWVRETWQGPLVEEQDILVSHDPDEFKNPEFCEYAADGGSRPEFCDDDGGVHHGWRPSANMPRWASRITLEITGVRVERLHDISDEGAIAEGAPNLECQPYNPQDEHKAQTWFRGVWSGIYGPDVWKSNPWVWVIEFKVVSDE
ncbi:morphogenetic protein [Lonsdalea quercina]|uniref:morphogenetic protein n=1 Tax=Lonsdalea quercina TaxID=71657 RepID=UPI003976A3E9